MKNSISTIVILSLIVTGCSTTTYFSLEETYPEYIEEQLNKVERDTDVGVEVSLLLNNGNEVNGELLSVRDNKMILCKEYSATEEELANLTYPVLLFSNDEIKELTIEGSNWVWEGIAAGAVVGVGIGYFVIADASNWDVVGVGLLIPSVASVVGSIVGYALSKEDYVLKEIPPDYDWFILKPLSRYPDEEPEYLRAIK